jgi:hypothetical protein
LLIAITVVAPLLFGGSLPGAGGSVQADGCALQLRQRARIALFVALAPSR